MFHERTMGWCGRSDGAAWTVAIVLTLFTLGSVSVHAQSEIRIIVTERWSAAHGGNGHHYAGVKVEDGLTWEQARAVAEELGGYLATITSAEENAFVFENVASDPCLWNAEAGPYLGGFQNLDSPDYNEPNGGWEWVTGEAWAYDVWDPHQPDNAHPGEHLLHLWNPNAAQCPLCDDDPPCGPNNAWNDIYVTDNWLDSLIVEFEADCPADLDDDGEVGVRDLLILLVFWGPCGEVCIGDIDRDEEVDFNDLLIVLGAWGPCE